MEKSKYIIGVDCYDLGVNCYILYKIEGGVTRVIESNVFRSEEQFWDTVEKLSTSHNAEIYKWLQQTNFKKL